MVSRLTLKFDQLRSNNQKAFIAYIMAGDPNPEYSRKVLEGLPNAGVDIIELGIPFTDPMADGPTIQLAGQRALAAGQTVSKTLSMVRDFRKTENETPIILMGYYNPIYSYGVERFIKESVEIGVDGLIIVDLPPEEDQELCIPANEAGLSFIRLATPTTDDKRLPRVLENTNGFVYFVSITGITGARAPKPEEVAPDVARIKKATDLPVCVGFGVKTPDMAKAISNIADGVVVGSSIVNLIGEERPVKEVLEFVQNLSEGVNSQTV